MAFPKKHRRSDPPRAATPTTVTVPIAPGMDPASCRQLLCGTLARAAEVAGPVVIPVIPLEMGRELLHTLIRVGAHTDRFGWGCAEATARIASALGLPVEWCTVFGVGLGAAEAAAAELEDTVRLTLAPASDEDPTPTYTFHWASGGADVRLPVGAPVALTEAAWQRAAEALAQQLLATRRLIH